MSTGCATSRPRSSGLKRSSERRWSSGRRSIESFHRDQLSEWGSRPRGNASPDDSASQPMTRLAGDGAGLLAAFRAAVDNLAAHVDEVNALNVFPVPDGDTG